jgi:hypothetical protein
VGKTFKALERHYNLSSNPTIGQKESDAQPIGYFKIYKIERPIAKKIVLNLNQSVIRDIIEYKYFLNIKDYLKFVNGEIFKSDEGRYYKIGFESRVMPTILLDRTGNLINFIVSRNPHKLLKGKTPTMHNLLGSAAIDRLEGRLIENIFTYIDSKTLKTLFKEIFKLSLYGDIICKDGNITFFDDQVAYELVICSTIRFFIFMDIRGNFIDTAASDDYYEWENLVKDLYHGKNILPSLNLFKDPSQFYEQDRDPS